MTPRYKIAIAGFQHETNTFAPERAGLEDFKRGGGWPPLTSGSALMQRFAPLNIPIGGFILAAQDAVDFVPILWTAAEPSNVVETDAFDTLTSWIETGLRRAGRIDGLYLDLHGAMVTEDHEDGESSLVRRLREALGPDVPIVASLDLHANIAPELVALTDALTLYRTYPHLDMDAAGARAWDLLQDMLETGRRPAKALRQSSVIIPLSAQCTDFGPLAELYGGLDALGVRSADLALGFPPADIANMGPAAVAYADDQAAADAAADRLVAALESIADTLDNRLLEPHAAVAEALDATRDGGAAVIADVQDNPGAGATSDTTGLLRALVDAGAPQSLLGALWDPEAARQAHALGVGETASFVLGGKFGPEGAEPLPVRARVEALSDGRFLCTGAMQRDVESNIGPTALLRLEEGGGGICVVVSSVRHQCIDQAMFRHLGLALDDQRLIVVKSTVHFRADFAPLAKRVLMAAAPGHNPCRLGPADFHNLRPGLRFSSGRTAEP